MSVRFWFVLLMAILACAPAKGAPVEIPVRATAYSWREPAHRKWGTKNAIGGSLARPLEGLGHCAVDPGVIPLGSILHVPGIGPRIATDTGRLIRGRDLDIHFDSLGEMRDWGVRRVAVRVLRWGWGSAKSGHETRRSFETDVPRSRNALPEHLGRRARAWGGARPDTGMDGHRTSQDSHSAGRAAASNTRREPDATGRSRGRVGPASVGQKTERFHEHTEHKT